MHAAADSGTESHRIVIIGGGTAGLTVAARLARQIDPAQIAVVEPSDKHYYQPLWTLVGAGVVPKEYTERTEASLMPKGVHWLRERVEGIEQLSGC